MTEETTNAAPALRPPQVDVQALLIELLQHALHWHASRLVIEHDSALGWLRAGHDGGSAALETLAVQRPSQAIAGLRHVVAAARWCSVQQGQHHLEFDPRHAARLVYRGERPADPECGWRIELLGIAVPPLQHALQRLARGYPLSVALNGVEVPRPHDLSRLPGSATAVGLVHLAGWHGGAASLHTAVYLDGLPWLTPAGPVDPELRCNVVHLDSELLERPRAPDPRGGELGLAATVAHAVRTLWRQRLQQQKQRLEPGDLVTGYFEAARLWRHEDLFDDVPLLPASVARPLRTDAACAAQAVSREDVVSGRLVLAELDGHEPPHGPKQCYARCAGWHEWIDQVSEQHWAQPHVRRLSQESVQLEACGPTLRCPFLHAGLDCELVCCDALALTVNGQTLQTDSEVVYDGVRLWIPRRAAAATAAQALPADRAGDGIDAEQRAAALRAQLSACIDRLRSGDPAATFTELLDGLGLDRYPCLRGHAFEVRIGAHPGSSPCVSRAA